MRGLSLPSVDKVVRQPATRRRISLINLSFNFSRSFVIFHYSSHHKNENDEVRATVLVTEKLQNLPMDSV